MTRQFGILISVSLMIVSIGCTTSQQSMWPLSTQQVVNSGHPLGFRQQEYTTDTFVLTAFEKITAPECVRYHIYIEGDGNSWQSRHVLSRNPTPKQPLALQLAYQDTHPNVIYLARPCQYTSHQQDRLCHSRYWSSHRSAPEVLQAFDQTLSQIQTRHNKQANFLLIGFSGGGGIAALLSTKRDDITCLVTLAGDLNHQTLSQYHRTTPLKGSLDPAHYGPQLSSLPQVHFSGQHDTVVPPWVAKHFITSMNQPYHAKHFILENVEHHRGWLEQSMGFNQTIQKECRLITNEE